MAMTHIYCVCVCVFDFNLSADTLNLNGEINLFSINTVAVYMVQDMVL